MNKPIAIVLSKAQMLEHLEDINSPSIPTRLLWMELDEAATPDAEQAALAKATAWLKKRGLYPG